MKKKMTADSLLEMMQYRRQRSDIFKVQKEKTVDLEFYTQQKYLLKIKVKRFFF